jgi:ABC-type uncharacterized transport system substrate-binding protein
MFAAQRDQIRALAHRHAIPMLSSSLDPDILDALITYGARLTESYRQVGIYTGKILAGAKPKDLPVLRPTKFLRIRKNRQQTQPTTACWCTPEQNYHWRAEVCSC